MLEFACKFGHYREKSTSKYYLNLLCASSRYYSFYAFFDPLSALRYRGNCDTFLSCENSLRMEPRERRKTKIFHHINFYMREFNVCLLAHIHYIVVKKRVLNECQLEKAARSQFDGIQYICNRYGLHCGSFLLYSE